jgi:glycosyltransferase involved in cell wall biosynthesis
LMSKPAAGDTDVSPGGVGLRRRVLQVSGPAAGGMRRHVIGLTEGLPAYGWEVATAAPEGVRTSAAGVGFQLALGDRPRPASDLRAIRSLREVIRDWAPVLVHAHGVKAALVTLLARPAAGPPVVVTFHNLWPGGALTLPLRLLAPRAAAAIAVSEAVRERLAAHSVHLRRLEVIPNGIDLRSYAPAASLSTDRPFTVAFLGRLTEEKGIPVLLEAARRLPDAVELRLVIAGDGPLRTAVEAEVLRPGSRVWFLGYQEQVLSVYQAADVVVMPSLAEGHPMAALEAMACGLPVVASRVGGLQEIVIDGETGMLTPPGDAASLGAALAALAADRERGLALGAAGRRRVEAHFTRERMLARLHSVYASVLAPSDTPKRPRQKRNQRSPSP